MDTYILQDFSLELETEKKNVVHSTDTKHLVYVQHLLCEFSKQSLN
jgi:hypothetical protein